MVQAMVAATTALGWVMGAAILVHWAAERKPQVATAGVAWREPAATDSASLAV